MPQGTITIDCDADELISELEFATALLKRLGQLGFGITDIPKCPSKGLLVDVIDHTADTSECVVRFKPSEFLLEWTAALRALENHGLPS